MPDLLARTRWTFVTRITETPVYGGVYVWRNENGTEIRCPADCLWSDEWFFHVRDEPKVRL